jgi:hypothetical protein
MGHLLLKLSYVNVMNLFCISALLIPLLLYDVTISAWGIQDDDDCDSGFWDRALQEFGESLGLSQPDVVDAADPAPIAWSPPSEDDEGPVGSPKGELLSDGDDAKPMGNPKAALLGEESSKNLSIKISNII